MGFAKRTALWTLLLVTTNAAFPAGEGSGKIRYSYPGGIVFFFIDGPNDGHANSACPAGGTPTRWAIDTTTPQGKLIFSQLMLAYAADKSITVYGEDGRPCIHGNTEEVMLFQVH